MKLPALVISAALIAGPVFSSEFTPAMENFLEAEIRAWSTNEILIESLKAQNQTSTSYDQGQIDAMDQAWRAEIGSGATPTIDPILSNAAADFLRGQVDASAGAITEIILMDAVGLNAAVSHVTSDMWQGDEAKYQSTYSVGPDAVHFSDVEKDESSGAFQAQISFTIVDPDTGTPIGAMTVGVDADLLL